MRPEGREPLDLRLAGPAGAAWLVAWQGRLLPPTGLMLTALLLLVMAGFLGAPRRPLSPGGSVRRWLAAASLVCAAASALVTGLHVRARESGPLADAARRSAAVTLEVTLVTDPRVVRPRGDVLAFRRLVVAKARVTRLTTAGREVRLRQPVLVLSSDAALLGLLPSQRLRLEGRVRAPDRGDDVAALLSVRGEVVRLGGPSRVQQVAGRLRQGLRDATDPLPHDERGLLPGLVDGDVSRLDPRLEEDFRLTGLTHLTAVSGSNVAVVVGAALLLCRWVGVALRVRPAIGLLALLGFVVLARPEPSVLRAGTMGVVGLLALGAGTRAQAAPALCGAVLALVLVSPDLAPQPGFALSTLATAGLLVLAPVWRDRLSRRLPRWLAEAIAVPAAAQVACTPVVVALSGSVGLLAVPANLLAVISVAPATVLGVLAALLAPVWLPLAQVCAWLGFVPTWWLVTLAHTGAAQPGAGTSLPAGWVGAILSLLLLAALAVVLARPALRRLAAATTAGVLIAVVGLVVLRPGWPPPGWLLVSCDVGQGDSYVVRLDTGVLVIDAGPDPQRVDRCLRRLGVDRVALLVLTHLHADHVEGVPGVLRGRQVGEVEIGPLDEPAVERERLLGWLGERRVPVTRAQIGEVRRRGDVAWEVLDATARHGTDSDPNNSSIVLRLVTHGVSVLFAGDLESDAQRSLRERGAPLQSDIVKVPHHGSRKQDPGFLDAIRAKVALTPVGAGNPYGHPAAATLTRLARDGARIYRSDLDGDVAVALTGSQIITVGRGGDGTQGVVAGAHHALPRDSGVLARPVLGMPASALTACDSTEPPTRVLSQGPVRQRGPPDAGL